MAEDVIITGVADRVATLTFNRPDKLNALSPELLARSIETLNSWSNDAEIGCIVVTGTGRAFCAGGDVSMMARDSDQTLEQRVDGLRQMQQLSWLLYNIPKVTVAAVNGFAMGAGLGVCLSCDLRIASEQARFGTAYAKVGYGGDFGTTWLLTHYVGGPKAKELFFLGDIIDAAEALRIGLINRVVSAESLSAEVSSVASRVAHGPLTSYRYMKSNVNMAASTDFRTLLDREAETHIRCSFTEDHKEGVRAFMEKREPRFTGR
ncbi:MAG TPA: enoyl-CoA hydratase [Blastocatellia bacterium]|nr:enoyl-CoA hydratase [Blastocatellia bacterium]